jgi:hypothetical protein
MRTNVKRVRRRKRAALLLAFPVIAAAWWLLHLAPLLLNRAVLIADPTAPDEFERRHIHFGELWDTDRSLIYERRPMPTDPDIARKAGRTAVRYDIVTKRETILEHLTRNRLGFEPERSEDLAVSPDGKWFAQSVRFGGSLIAEVEGPRRGESDAGGNGGLYKGIFWSADSRSWFEVFTVNKYWGIVAHDVGSANGGEAGRNVQNESIRADPSWADRARSIEAMPSIADAVSVETMGGAGNHKPFAIVSHLSFAGQPVVVSQKQVKLPIKCLILRTAVSTNGDKIAWVASVERINRFLSILHRYLYFVPDPAGTELQLWISRVDGTEMRCLGVKMAEADEGGFGDYPDQIDRLTWLAGGHKLSFEVDDKLYTINAD